MHDQLRTFVCKSARYRVLWRRCAPRVKSHKSLLCHFQREIIHLPYDPVDSIQITNNIQLSHKAVQGPSVELNKEVPVQACLQPLIFIIQMFSFHQQTVQNTDNRQALMEDDEDCKKRPEEMPLTELEQQFGSWEEDQTLSLDTDIQMELLS